MKEMRWCGRIIEKDGYVMEPARLEALQAMQVPEYADELSTFIYCCRWMQISLPGFVKHVHVLNEVLEKAYRKTGKRTKKAIRGLPLRTLSWNDGHVNAFMAIKDSIIEAVRLSYPDPNMVPCVFTDASDFYWSGVVTQVSRNELQKPFNEQHHQPLAFWEKRSMVPKSDGLCLRRRRFPL